MTPRSRRAQPVEVVEGLRRQVRPGWRDAAGCAGSELDPDDWYPLPSDDAAAARAVCAGCPVRASCLAVALLQRERHGIWGGLDPEQRTRLHLSLTAHGAGPAGPREPVPLVDVLPAVLAHLAAGSVDDGGAAA